MPDVVEEPAVLEDEVLVNSEDKLEAIHYLLLFETGGHEVVVKLLDSS